jgi:hypothetical protein
MSSSDELPPGSVRDQIDDPKFQDQIKGAQVIRGVHHLTGDQIGLFYGAAVLRRIIRKETEETASVMNVPLNPDTDDIEALIAVVKAVKGDCCYPTEE